VATRWRRSGKDRDRTMVVARTSSHIDPTIIDPERIDAMTEGAQ
jgi:hypothetical protein